ncbi:MAG: peptidylprolyl isomerase [Pseudomonadota bacterium]
MSSQPRIKISTRLGDIVVELNAEAAPKTVANVLTYVDEGFYDGTLFHRVIPGFMIQGGGLTPDMGNKPNHAPIENEATNGLPNVRGSIAMARTPNPHSATSQFFINLKDNAFLNYTSPTPNGWGYCVFGKVVEGMHVVDAIAAEPTGMRAGHADVPREDVLIDSVTRIETEA